MLLAATAIAFSHLRDPVLALSAVLAPLTGVSLVLCGASNLPALLPAGFLAALVYVLGFAVALAAGDRFASRVADGEDSETAARATLQPDTRRFASALVFSTAMPCILAVNAPARLGSIALLLTAGNAVAILSAWFAVPLAGSFVAGGEDFIARANRIRESRQFRFERVAKAAQPPWASSAAGILVVLLAVAFFGSARLVVAPELRRVLLLDIAGAVILLSIAAYLATGAWRRAAAVWVAMAGASLFGVWGFARTGAVFDAPLALATAELCAICFLPIAWVAASAAISGRDDAAGASEAGLADGGATAATAFFAALILLLPWYRDIGAADAGFVLAIGFAAGGALAFQPAVASALEDLVPRRKNLAQRYRVK
jgi:hypothetical protein